MTTEMPEGPRGIARLVERIALFFGGLGVTAFSAAVIYTVSMRYLFHKTPYWAEEFPRLLLVWVTFLGVAAATARDSHLSAGVMPLVVRNPALRRHVARLARLCTLGFMVVVGWTGWELAQNTWASLTPALQVPMAWTYLALPVAAALCCVAGAARLKD